MKNCHAVQLAMANQATTGSDRGAKHRKYALVLLTGSKIRHVAMPRKAVLPRLHSKLNCDNRDALCVLTIRSRSTSDLANLLAKT